MKKNILFIYFSILVIAVFTACGSSSGNSDENATDSSTVKTDSNKEWNDLTTDMQLSLISIINGDWFDEKNPLSVTINLELEPDNAVADFRTATWIEKDESQNQVKGTFCVSNECGKKVDFEDLNNPGRYLTIYTAEEQICYLYKIEVQENGSTNTFKLTLTANDGSKTERVFTRIQQN